MTKGRRDELRGRLDAYNGRYITSLQPQLTVDDLIRLLDAADEAERLREENDYYRAQLDPNRVTRLD